MEWGSRMYAAGHQKQIEDNSLEDLSHYERKLKMGW